MKPVNVKPIAKAATKSSAIEPHDQPTQISRSQLVLEVSQDSQHKLRQSTSQHPSKLEF